MQLILAQVSSTLAARLAKKGISGWVLGDEAPAGWARLAQFEQALALAGPRLWFADASLSERIPASDILIACGSHSCQHPRAIGLCWQESPFALEHGFLFAAGGDPVQLAQLSQLLDHLAPVSGGWLHAGGQTAPRFLAQITQLASKQLNQLAGVMMGLPGGLPSWWASHYALLSELAQLAQQYLDQSADEPPYQGLHPLPPSLIPRPPGASEYDSPARRLAHLLCWLEKQGALAHAVHAVNKP